MPIHKRFIVRCVMLMAVPAALSLFAAGCKKDGASGGVGGKNALTWWHFMDNDLVAPLIAKYEAEHPGLKIEHQQLDWTNGLNKLQMSVASGSQPDLAEFGSTDVLAFAETGKLADIGPQIADMREEFVLWEPGEFEGKTYALPWVVGPRVLFYNKKLLREAGVSPEMTPPSTWAQLLSAARQTFNREAGVYGFGMNAGESNVIYKKFLPFAWGIGGDVMSPDGRAVFNSPEVKEALRFYLRLQPYSLMEKQAMIDAKFIEGKVALWISGGWLVTKIQAGAPDLEYGTALIPKHSPARGEPLSFGGAEMLAVFESSKRKEDAAAFAKFLAQPENALELCKANATFLPAKKDLSGIEHFKDKPELRGLVNQMAHTKHTPIHPKWKRIEKEVDDAVEQAQLGQDPDRMLDEANKAIDTILRAP